MLTIWTATFRVSYVSKHILKLFLITRCSWSPDHNIKVCVDLVYTLPTACSLHDYAHTFWTVTHFRVIFNDGSASSPPFLLIPSPKVKWRQLCPMRTGRVWKCSKRWETRYLCELTGGLLTFHKTFWHFHYLIECLKKAPTCVLLLLLFLFHHLSN